MLKIGPTFKLEKKGTTEYITVLNSIMANYPEQKSTIIVETGSDGVRFMCATPKIQVFFRTIGASSDKIESICLGLKCFVQLLKYSKPLSITFVHNRKYLSAFTPDTNFHFKTLPPDRITFIQPYHKYYLSLTVSTAEFRRTLTEVRSVFSKKESPVHQNVLYFRITNNLLLFLSVNRDRACYSAVRIKRMGGDCNLLPTNFKPISSMIETEEFFYEEEMELQFYDNRIILRSERVRVVCQNDNCPAFGADTILAKKFRFVFSVNRVRLNDALHQTKVLTEENSKNIIFALQKKTLVLKTSNSYSERTEGIVLLTKPKAWAGNFAVAVRITYLMDFLTSVSFENVNFYVEDDSHCILLTGDDRFNYYKYMITSFSI